MFKAKYRRLVRQPQTCFVFVSREKSTSVENFRQHCHQWQRLFIGCSDRWIKKTLEITGYLLISTKDGLKRKNLATLQWIKSFRISYLKNEYRSLFSGVVIGKYVGRNEYFHTLRGGDQRGHSSKRKKTVLNKENIDILNEKITLILQFYRF